MSRVSLRLPDQLHRKLEMRARQHGVSLHRYLIYLLTQGSAPPYNVTSSSLQEVRDQQADYANLLGKLGSASHQEIQKALQEREATEPEPGLTPELLERMQSRLDRSPALGSQSNPASYQSKQSVISRFSCDLEPSDRIFEAHAI
ncbi:MAG: toxin-antitoxin system HicB family antitoxin [Acidobacteriota bacterium]